MLYFRDAPARAATDRSNCLREKTQVLAKNSVSKCSNKYESPLQQRSQARHDFWLKVHTQNPHRAIDPELFRFEDRTAPLHQQAIDMKHYHIPKHLILNQHKRYSTILWMTPPITTSM